MIFIKLLTYTFTYVKISIEKDLKMLTYSKDEMVGVTEFGKSIGAFLNKVVENPLNKLVILRRNKPEAVIIPIEECENLKKPNTQTIEAIKEVENMKKNPHLYKSYNSFSEIIQEIDDEI